MATPSHQGPKPGPLRRLLTFPFRLGPPDKHLAWNGFGGLAVVNNLSSAGDALVAVALAGSIFVSAPVHAARGRTALGLVCTLVPFAVIAPFVGPLTDRVRAGPRLIMFLAGLGRVAACVMIAVWLHNLLLFPAAFLYLVCSKTHAVARASLVPAVVDRPEGLLAANAKLAVGSSIASGCLAGFGALVYKLLGSDTALALASLIFVATAALAVDLLPRTGSPRAPDGGTRSSGGRTKPPPAVVQAGVAMAGLRAVSGFMTALVIFALRQQAAPLVWYGAVGLAAVAANLGGASVAPWARRLAPERRLVAGSSLLVGLTALAVTQFPDARRRLAALVLVLVVGVAASVAKTAFDAIVQTEIPPLRRATFFARLEALFQLAWVLGALACTVAAIPLLPGFIVVATVVLITGALAVIGLPGMRRHRESSSPGTAEQSHASALRQHQVS